LTMSIIPFLAVLGLRGDSDPRGSGRVAGVVKISGKA
jgi:hypothetical protein